MKLHSQDPIFYGIKVCVAPPPPQEQTNKKLRVVGVGMVCVGGGRGDGDSQHTALLHSYGGPSLSVAE